MQSALTEIRASTGTVYHQNACIFNASHMFKVQLSEATLIHSKWHQLKPISAGV